MEEAIYSMLPARPERKKPCPVQCFQNAEQGLYGRGLERVTDYGLAGGAAGAAAAGAAALPSFGVAR